MQNLDVYSLIPLQDPASGEPEVELTYTRFAPTQSIRMLRRDLDALILIQIQSWAQTSPASLKAHPDFVKLLNHLGVS